uniref:Uncharacterized protein n=3 Tax=Cryptomonas curvata TaxID=233186 RepID=A0A7S0M7W1_9CRYP|mmetsp:Transcript_28834/g.60415  ORF Transcript_28834/g.60415 Transcript_28834/m.60415 type:complete len:189 (+) Transcript_28834:784-1350(+)
MELSFKNRGYFSGENNSVDGKIKRGSDTLYKIHGRWDRVVTCTEKKTKQEEVLFDIEEKRRYFTPPTVVPEAKQKHYESRRVWSQVSQALKAQNIDLATEEKLRLEDGQRAGKKERDDSGSPWVPRLFDNLSPSDAKSLNWRFKLSKLTPYEGDVESEARWEADLLSLVSQGELAVGRDMMRVINPSA